MKDLLELREECFLFLACLWRKGPSQGTRHVVTTVFGAQAWTLRCPVQQQQPS